MLIFRFIVEHCFNVQIVCAGPPVVPIKKKMDKATVTSPVGLWTPVLAFQLSPSCFFLGQM